MKTHMNTKHKDLAKTTGKKRKRMNEYLQRKNKEWRDKNNAKRREKRRVGRLDEEKHAARNAIDAYWADKPYYITRDEFIESCKADKLTEPRIEAMWRKWLQQRGSDVPAQTCITYM